MSDRAASPCMHQTVAGYKQVTLNMICHVGAQSFTVYWVIGGLEYEDAKFQLNIGQSDARTYPVQFERIRVIVTGEISGSSTYSLGLFATE